MTDPIRNENIDRLLAIQEIDGQIAELEAERDERPAALRREQDAVAKGRARLEEAQKRQKEAQSGVDRLNILLLGREGEIRKLQLQMLAPKITNKEYQAFQNQIASVRADNALTEERVLEGMEEVDRLHEEAEACRRELAGHEAALDEARSRVETEVARYDGQIEVLQAERRDKLAALPLEIIQVYERVHEARGPSVVAAVSEGYCQGCYMNVTTQDVALILRGDRLMQCRTCQRILYVPNPADWITGA